MNAIQTNRNSSQHNKITIILFNSEKYLMNNENISIFVKVTFLLIYCRYISLVDIKTNLLYFLLTVLALCWHHDWASVLYLCYYWNAGITK